MAKSRLKEQKKDKRVQVLGNFAQHKPLKDMLAIRPVFFALSLNQNVANRQPVQGALKGKYHCTIDLLFDWFGISCMTTDNFCFYFQNTLIQTSQTGGQQYGDTSLFIIP
jgi:hypothetical protein